MFAAEDFFGIQPNSKNGMENGLSVLVDVEAFDYSYYPRGSEGFDIALADSRDRAVVRQQGRVWQIIFFRIMITVKIFFSEEEKGFLFDHQ